MSNVDQTKLEEKTLNMIKCQILSWKIIFLIVKQYKLIHTADST